MRLISRGYRIPAGPREVSLGPLSLPFTPLPFLAPLSNSISVFPSPFSSAFTRPRYVVAIVVSGERGKRVPDTRPYFCIDCRQGSPLGQIGRPTDAELRIDPWKVFRSVISRTRSIRNSDDVSSFLVTLTQLIGNKAERSRVYGATIFQVTRCIDIFNSFGVK